HGRDVPVPGRRGRRVVAGERAGEDDVSLFSAGRHLFAALAGRAREAGTAGPAPRACRAGCGPVHQLAGDGGGAYARPAARGRLAPVLRVSAVAAEQLYATVGMRRRVMFTNFYLALGISILAFYSLASYLGWELGTPARESAQAAQHRHTSG